VNPEEKTMSYFQMTEVLTGKRCLILEAGPAGASYFKLEFCRVHKPSLRLNYYVKKIAGHRSQWNLAQMNDRHPWQLKKSKSLGPFGSYLLNSTANPAHLLQK
jgi:hypothetical protein